MELFLVSLIIFSIGFLIGIVFNKFIYSKRLIEKANAPKDYGGSNMIFVRGLPLVIMHEKDYLKSSAFLHNYNKTI